MPEEQKTEEQHQMRNLGETLTPHKYQATYVRQGTQGKKKSVLLIKLRDDQNHELCDHLWVRYTKHMERLNSGDTIEFTATPVRYIKGYSGTKHEMTEFQTDVTLSDITHIRVLGNNPVIEKKVKDWTDKHKVAKQ